MIMLICVKQHLSSIMKKLSNTEAELKKSVAYKKSVCLSYYVNSYSLNKLYSSLWIIHLSRELYEITPFV